MKTLEIKDLKGRVLKNSIAELKQVIIGGVDQFLLIRGTDKRKPVLLFVPGGPGQGEIGYMSSYQRELEEEFVVVRWDQRGGGLSASKQVEDKDLTVETFTKDLDQVTDYLLNRFNQKKIILAGHSWGTVIGLYAVKNNPHKYMGYIGVGQVVNSEESEKIAYEYTLAEAENQGKKKIIKALKDIGYPPYDTQKVFTRINCMGRVGGVVKTNPPRSMVASLLLSKEYSLKAKVNYQKNCMRCAKIMHPEIMKIDLLKEITKVEIPIFFIAGRYDYITPTSLVDNLYKNIEAPLKKLSIFENSAHLPQLEETKRFSEEVIRFKERLTKFREELV